MRPLPDTKYVSLNLVIKRWSEHVNFKSYSFFSVQLIT